MTPHWLPAYSRIPFVDGGRSHEGVDCWGLVQLVYREQLHIELPSYGEISAEEMLRIAGQIGEETHDSEVWVPVAEPMMFDVVVMTWFGRRVPGHVGIHASRRTIIHTERPVGMMVVERDHYTVRTRIRQTFRHRSMLK